MTGAGGTRTDAYDVVVVGGGVAGLSAALQLARARRSVLVVDEGRPRNTPSARSHGFLTRDGSSPAALVERGRAEVTGYGGEVVTGRVTAASPAADGGFTVVLDGGASVRARRLLLATGLVDELPGVPGVAERWGRDVVHCPYCHGWEVRDRAVGVLATGAMAVHQALLFRQWSEDVTLLLHTAAPPGDADLERLEARGVAVVHGEVARLEVADDRLSGVRLAAGGRVPLAALAVAPRSTPSPAVAAVLACLGLGLSEHPTGLGAFVVVDATGRTDVPGVWAAGNLADLSAQLLPAAASGARTAAMVNADLVTEDAERAVAARRASTAPVGA